MNVIVYPNDILRQKSTPVEKVNDELREFAKEMGQAMIDAKGLGISAPQVGRNIRVIIVMVDGHPVYMFNPVILAKSQQKVSDLEGCLSFPNEYIQVVRPFEVKLKYRDLDNKMKYAQLSGTSARAVMHEMDHLQGILLEDYK